MKKERNLVQTQGGFLKKKNMYWNWLALEPNLNFLHLITDEKNFGYKLKADSSLKNILIIQIKKKNKNKCLKHF